jgi:hypothetical protein
VQFTTLAGTRREVQATAPVDGEGWVRLVRLPAGLTWAETTRIDLNGIPGPSFILGPVEHLD